MPRRVIAGGWLRRGKPIPDEAQKRDVRDPLEDDIAEIMRMVNNNAKRKETRRP